MPTLFQTNWAKGINPSPNPGFAGELVAQRFAFTWVAGIIVNDIIEMGQVPGGCRVVDCILDADDIDINGAPTVTFDVGIFTGEAGSNDSARVCNAVFFAASTVGQAGTTARPTLKTAFRDVATAAARGIGLKCTAVCATFAAGEVGLTVLMTSG